jgi:hypothetical protein
MNPLQVKVRENLKKLLMLTARNAHRTAPLMSKKTMRELEAKNTFKSEKVNDSGELHTDKDEEEETKVDK